MQIHVGMKLFEREASKLLDNFGFMSHLIYNVTVRSHRRQREHKSGRKTLIFKVSRLREQRVLGDESIKKSWNQVNFMVMSYDAVGRQPIGMLRRFQRTQQCKPWFRPQ